MERAEVAMNPKALWVLMCSLGVACGGTSAAEQMETGPEGDAAPTSDADTTTDSSTRKDSGSHGHADSGSLSDGGADSGSPSDGGADSGGDADSGSDLDAALGIACTDASPSFAGDIEPIFARSCGGAELCHGGLIRFGDSGPPAIWPYDSLVNVKASRDPCAASEDLVKPGSLEGSYLMHKLMGVGMCEGTVRMPRIGVPLPNADLQSIADWICDGAKNN